jgi:hypothetical protein
MADYDLLKQWARSIPVWKIICSAIPLKSGKDPLLCAFSLTPFDVTNISSELGKASACMIEQYVIKLRTLFTSMDAASSEKKKKQRNS